MKYIILHFYLRGESYFEFSTTNKLLEGLVHVQGDTAKLDTCKCWWQRWTLPEYKMKN